MSRQRRISIVIQIGLETPLLFSIFKKIIQLPPVKKHLICSGISKKNFIRLSLCSCSYLCIIKCSFSWKFLNSRRSWETNFLTIFCLNSLELDIGRWKKLNLKSKPLFIVDRRHFYRLFFLKNFSLWIANIYRLCSKTMKRLFYCLLYHPPLRKCIFSGSKCFKCFSNGYLKVH